MISFKTRGKLNGKSHDWVKVPAVDIKTLIPACRESWGAAAGPDPRETSTPPLIFPLLVEMARDTMIHQVSRPPYCHACLCCRHGRRLTERSVYYIINYILQ